MTRQLRGQIAYYNGLRAEDVVARDYAQRGLAVVARRWRGRGGELDMILRAPDGLVIVEVKCGQSCAQAAQQLRPAQIRRILAATEEFIGGQPQGLATACRIDLALVDHRGRLEVIENALMAA